MISTRDRSRLHGCTTALFTKVLSRVPRPIRHIISGEADIKWRMGLGMRLEGTLDERLGLSSSVPCYCSVVLYVSRIAWQLNGLLELIRRKL